jgi:hypothetical protein
VGAALDLGLLVGACGFHTARNLDRARFSRHSL